LSSDTKSTVASSISHIGCLSGAIFKPEDHVGVIIR